MPETINRQFTKGPAFYNQRKEHIRLHLAIQTLLSVFVGFFLNWTTALAAFLFLSLFLFIWIKRKYTYFLRSITLDETGLLTLRYDQGRKKCVKSGYICDFRFRKSWEILFSDPLDTHFSVRYMGKLLLRQFETGSWTEIAMNNLLKKINSITD